MKVCMNEGVHSFRYPEQTVGRSGCGALTLCSIALFLQGSRVLKCVGACINGIHRCCIMICPAGVPVCRKQRSPSRNFRNKFSCVHTLSCRTLGNRVGSMRGIQARHSALWHKKTCSAPASTEMSVDSQSALARSSQFLHGIIMIKGVTEYSVTSC